jgi:hypothetical protein
MSQLRDATLLQALGSLAFDCAAAGVYKTQMDRDSTGEHVENST